MIPQYQHNVTTSYMLWFENFFFKKSQAYSVQTGILTHYVDDRLPVEYEVFGSQYKQLVYDSSLPNVYIPDGLYANGNFININLNNNNILDYDNARFISNEISATTLITGKFTTKDINIYFTNDTEEKIVINVQDKINQSVDNKHDFYSPVEQKLPAIYLSNQSFYNKPFAFGGMNETVINAKAVVLANNSYDLDCVLSIFADSYNENIPLCNFDSHPLNEYSSLKTGYYSYEDIKNQYTEKMFVKYVNSSKLTDKIKQNLLKDLYIGFIDFELSHFRYRS